MHHQECVAPNVDNRHQSPELLHSGRGYWISCPAG